MLCIAREFHGTPEGIRTPDPLVRSQILYPAELLAHIATSMTNKILPQIIKFVKRFFEKNIDFFQKNEKMTKYLRKIAFSLEK